MPPAPRPCPLCDAPQAPHWLAETRKGLPSRDYHRCLSCGLVFVPADQHLTRDAEQAEYDRHRNDPADPGYRRFLGRILPPLQARLAPGARGLDYGCGPAPALQALLHEAGHPCAVYDPFYQPDTTVLAQTYDFITCTEVAEHFARPGAEFVRLISLLRAGGVLALMTRRPMTDADTFSRWHYSRDATHVCFYSEDCLRWIAHTHGLSLTLHGDDIALLNRQP